MGTKRPMSPNSSHFIEPHNFDHPFTSSCTTTNLSSTSSPMRTTNHTLITSLILTNHTPPTSPQPFCECGVPTLHFPKPPQSCITRIFFPSHSIGLQLAMIIPPNLPPFLQHTFNLHLESYVPLVGANLLIEGQLIINIPIRHLIHPMQTLVIILAQHLRLLPLHLHQLGFQ
jgi:hypothetical protein